MATTTETEWLTTAEAANLLKVSPLTISRWIKQGRLLASRVGPRVVRIRRDDLAEMMTPVIAPRLVAVEPPIVRPTPLPPVTPELTARRLVALDEMRKAREQILAERGGIPFESSAEIIREAREERSCQI